MFIFKVLYTGTLYARFYLSMNHTPWKIRSERKGLGSQWAEDNVLTMSLDFEKDIVITEECLVPL